jgi:hypothetical protein
MKPEEINEKLGSSKKEWDLFMKDAISSKEKTEVTDKPKESSNLDWSDIKWSPVEDYTTPTSYDPFFDKCVEEHIKEAVDECIKEYEKQEKSPIGVTPKNIWENRIKVDRLSELNSAIKRYHDAGLIINIEWVEEYNQIIDDLKSSSNGK